MAAHNPTEQTNMGIIYSNRPTTVRDLIAALQEMPQDMDVQVYVPRLEEYLDIQVVEKETRTVVLQAETYE
jgi:hypothetical protein